MDKSTAEPLMDAFEKHFTAFKPDREMFLPMLLSQPVPDSSKFYEKLPDNRQLMEEDDSMYYFLSLRRIIRNMNARAFMPGPVKTFFDGLLQKMGVYSSHSFTHSIKSSPDIVRLLDTSEYAFSLLGKLEIYEHGNPDDILYIAKKPVLIIPGAEGIEDVLKWEEENTQYYKESLLTHKRISKQEYLSS
jgi:hypothetical protein